MKGVGHGDVYAYVAIDDNSIGLSIYFNIHVCIPIGSMVAMVFINTYQCNH